MDDGRGPKPVAGSDYPATWSQFLEWFGDNAACARYLERLRWPTGFACKACGVLGEPYRASRGRLMCRACGHQRSVTAGTIFDKTRTPLTVWFAAIWYLTSQKHGVSALGLQRVLGLGSYQTAWTILHRLRRAMCQDGTVIMARNFNGLSQDARRRQERGGIANASPLIAGGTNFTVFVGSRLRETIPMAHPWGHRHGI